VRAARRRRWWWARQPSSPCTRASARRPLAGVYDLVNAQVGRGWAHPDGHRVGDSPGGCHPFSVGPDQCLVHNGSFANHATIRRRTDRRGRGVRQRERLRGGRPVRGVPAGRRRGPGQGTRGLCDRFDGFYTLLVTSADGFAWSGRDRLQAGDHRRDDAWVAMALEFGAAELPVSTARGSTNPNRRGCTHGGAEPWADGQARRRRGVHRRPAISSVGSSTPSCMPPTAGHYQVRKSTRAHRHRRRLRPPDTVDVQGHAGYYCAGMNQHAEITVHGSAASGSRRT